MPDGTTLDLRTLTEQVARLDELVRQVKAAAEALALTPASVHRSASDD